MIEVKTPKKIFVQIAYLYTFQQNANQFAGHRTFHA